MEINIGTYWNPLLRIYLFELNFIFPAFYYYQYRNAHGDDSLVAAMTSKSETMSHLYPKCRADRWLSRLKLSQLMRLWYLSHRRPAKAQAGLHIRAVSPEPSLFAHMNNGSRRRVRPKIRHPAPLDGCVCVFDECKEGKKYQNLMSWLNWSLTVAFFVLQANRSGSVTKIMKSTTLSFLKMFFLNSIMWSVVLD